MIAVIFAGLVGFLTIGFVWFWIARPILEDCGIIRDVNTSEEEAPALMSRARDAPMPHPAPSLQTVPSQTPDQTEDAAARKQKLLDTYRPLRKLGMSRDDARVFLHTIGIPLDNNVWAQAAPVAEEPVAYSPIAGRQIDPRLFSDPDFPYQAPA